MVCNKLASRASGYGLDDFVSLLARSSRGSAGPRLVGLLAADVVLGARALRKRPSGLPRPRVGGSGHLPVVPADGGAAPAVLAAVDLEGLVLFGLAGAVGPALIAAAPRSTRLRRRDLV